MSTLSHQSILRARPVDPILPRTRWRGMSYGLGPSTYDLRADVRPPDGELFLMNRLRHERCSRHLETFAIDEGGCEEAHWVLSIPPQGFALAAALGTRFQMPHNVEATVRDKSSWARMGLSVFNTYIDPGFEGYLTLELANLSGADIVIRDGDPIAQVKFSWLDEATEQPYSSGDKYHGQQEGAVPAIVS